MFFCVIKSDNGITDISNRVVDKLNIKTFFKDKPSILNLYVLSNEDDSFSEGDIVEVKLDEQNLFYGYIFTIKRDSGDLVSITAYDQIRYLITRDTYTYKDKTASQVISNICSNFNLSLGDIENTSYIIPYRIEENQTILDIIYTSLDLTTNFNGKRFIFFDNFGKITLKNYENMKLPIVIDYKNFSISYLHTTSIDKDVYNSVKVSVKNKKTNVISTYTEEDNTNKNKWGTLRVFKRLSNDYNAAQAQNYAKNLLSLKNKLKETVEITCFGDTRLRAGNIINILVAGENIREMMIEECIHTIKNNEHTMKLTLGSI